MRVHEIFQRGHRGPARDRRPGPRKMDTVHGARLGDRPLCRLLRDHVDRLPRLAPRPFVVRGALTATAVLLEGLQGLTPDRTPNFLAALYGAGGVPAALLAELHPGTEADPSAQ
jgi:hypothetical protein